MEEMRELYIEGIVILDGPESCVAVRLQARHKGICLRALKEIPRVGQAT
jgi:hypothetical protein